MKIGPNAEDLEPEEFAKKTKEFAGLYLVGVQRETLPPSNATASWDGPCYVFGFCKEIPPTGESEKPITPDLGLVTDGESIRFLGVCPTETPPDVKEEDWGPKGYLISIMGRQVDRVDLVAENKKAIVIVRWVGGGSMALHGKFALLRGDHMPVTASPPAVKKRTPPRVMWVVYNDLENMPVIFTTKRHAFQYIRELNNPDAATAFKYERRPS